MNNNVVLVVRVVGLVDCVSPVAPLATPTCHVGGWSWGNDNGELGAVSVSQSNCGVRCRYWGCESFRG